MKHFKVLFLQHTENCSVLPPPPLWSVSLEVCISPCPDGSSLESDGDTQLLPQWRCCSKIPHHPRIINHPSKNRAAKEFCGDSELLSYFGLAKMVPTTEAFKTVPCPVSPSLGHGAHAAALSLRSLLGDNCHHQGKSRELIGCFLPFRWWMA